jgi:hypothetical protein
MDNIRQSTYKYRYTLFPVDSYRYPRTLIVRHAITPTGKDSKYWATICKYGINPQEQTEKRLQEIANEMNLPKLPKGYTWSKPYLAV